MSIRTEAMRWFNAHHGPVSGHIVASKYYRSEESWTKTRVWWFEMQLSVIEEYKNSPIHFLCQSSFGSSSFYYLKVPGKFLIINEAKLFVMDHTKMSIYLSAEPMDMFVEKRGNGRLPFSPFLISG